MHFRVTFLVLAFRAIFHTHSDIRCHHFSLVWRPEPLYISVRAPWVLIFPVFWRWESLLLSCIIQSHGLRHSYSLASRVLPSWVCIYPRFPHFLPSAYHLFVIVLLVFPFHCSWRCPLSSRYVFLSCYWAPCTCCFLVVYAGQSPFGHFISCTLEWFDRYSSL